MAEKNYRFMVAIITVLAIGAFIAFIGAGLGLLALALSGVAIMVAVLLSVVGMLVFELVWRQV